MVRDSGPQSLTALPEERLQGLLKNVFIYTHGLAAPATEDPTAGELKSERALLREVGGRMIALAVMEERGDLGLQEAARRYHP